MSGPGLTMARSLGDMDADACGVVPTPEVSFRPLALGRDRFVILATDGLWEFLPSATVVEVVGGFFDRGDPAIEAARFLIAMAAYAWKAEEGDYRDDITAVVVYLDQVSRQIEGTVEGARSPGRSPRRGTPGTPGRQGSAQNKWGSGTMARWLQHDSPISSTEGNKAT